MSVNPEMPDVEPDYVTEEEAAQQREDDPDGDPDAIDPGDLYEAPSDVDPPVEQQLNSDADADLSEVDTDDDDGVDDYGVVEDLEPDEDPEVEPDDEPVVEEGSDGSA